MSLVDQNDKLYIVHLYELRKISKNWSSHTLSNN